MKTGCVYNITVGDKGIYVGSTENFDARLKTHKLNAKKKNYKIYKAIRDNGGEFIMTKLYDVEYENDVELRIQERMVYDELNPSLNSQRPFVSEEELKEDAKQRYIDNGVKIRETRKKYRIGNADKIKESAKQYYVDNVNKIQEYRKQYRIDNIVIITEKAKQYKIDNADKIKQYTIDTKEKRNKKITCVCGCEVVKRNLTQHNKTKRHLKLMAEKNVNLTME